MKIAEVLLLDFDEETEKTRRILERIPEDKPEWAPHPKSTPMGRLAMHVARLPEFAAMILSTDGFDAAAAKFPPLVFESSQRLLAMHEEKSTRTRAILASSDDDHLLRHWKLSFGDRTFADAPRATLYRTLFLNHLAHHRGQLSVYLRLNDLPVPGIYGPSADEAF
jgi:uncharacterized damage-inducible protein DinB